MWITVLFVALGGAIGASCRYLFGLLALRIVGYTEFPFTTLSVNVIGSFLMGICVVLLSPKGDNFTLSPFLMTGVLGGFTTFSAFSLDVVVLIDRGQLASAALYASLSVALSVAALMLGILIGRGVMWS